MSFSIPQPEQPGHSVLASTFEYNAWANIKLLDFCANLNDEQMDSSTVGGYGTIRKTLRHLVYSEASYVTRVNGKQPPSPLPREEFPGFEALNDAVRWANEELYSLSLSATNEVMVLEVWPEGTERYRLADLMVQATSHAMEHRTQVASIITSLGLEPPDTSTWAWMVETGTLELNRTAED